MHRSDKAVLRLAIGLGLAVLIAYGLSLPAPFVVCVMTALLLCKPGPPIPFGKGVVLSLMVGALLVAGVLMVPLPGKLRGDRRAADRRTALGGVLSLVRAAPTR
jgi:hypothetical protein